MSLKCIPSFSHVLEIHVCTKIKLLFRISIAGLLDIVNMHVPCFQLLEGILGTQD